MSYFDFFCKNIDNNNLFNNDAIKGTCYTMCPDDEIKLREKETLVHVLEVLGPMRKLVKSYSRSAADSNMAVPSLLRPYSVLRDTVQYLILEVTKRIDVPTSVVYDFVNDRLRAVRQDMTIQRLPPEECSILLEPMIRFYVYYGYKLSELPLKDYNPVLNKKYLLECVKWYLNCCDTMDRTHSKDIEQLTGSLFNLDIDNKRWKLKCDRELVESLYILCNLDDVHPLFRYVNLPKYVKRHPTLELSYKIAVANLTGNYVRVCKYLSSLCPLTYCALSVYLPVLQRDGLQAMSHAYHSKRLTVPCSALRRWLGFTTDQHVATTCTHYGLKVHGDAVMFDKAQFKHDAPLKLPSFPKPDRLNMNIDYCFTYSSKC